MNKKLFKRMAVMLALAAAFMSLCASCDTAPKEEIIASADGTEYTVVRGEFAGTTTIEAAVNLRKSIESITGVLPDITTDLEIPEKGIVRAEKEILVGDTNRSESNRFENELRPKDFVVDFSTSRITIIGGSDAATAKGVEYFLENFADAENKTVALPKNTYYMYDHPYPDVEFGGTKLEDCYIFYDNLDIKKAQKIREAVNDATDKYMKLADENTPEDAKGLRFVVDESLELLKCEVRTDGNGMVEIASRSQNGFEKCVELLEKALSAESAATDFNSNYSLKEDYTVKQITEFDAAKKHFVGSTDKDPISYEIGEEMTFKIALYAGEELASCPKFSWSVAGDDGKKDSGIVSGESGEITVKASSDVAGYVRVIVKACDENGQPIEGVDVFEGGAGAGFEQIEQGKPEPEDFDAFWAKQYDKLLDVKPVLVESTEVGGKEGFKVFDVRVDMGDELPVSGYLTYPENAEPGSLKIRATYMGYGVNTPGITCIDGAITFSVNAHSIVNGETPEFYTELRAKEFPSYGFEKDKNSDPETVYFKEMIMRDVQAVRFLMASELWNGKDIELSGGSQGAFQTTAVACILADKVTKITIGIPWMCDLGGITIGRMRGWRPDYTDAMGYYDTVNFAKRVVCPTYINAGLGDYICPPSGVTALYNAFTCPKEIVFYQNRTHSYMPTVHVTTMRSEGIDKEQ